MPDSDKIYSIIIASNKPDNFSKFMDNLEDTCASPRSFEVLVKVDEEDRQMVTRALAEEAKRPFEMKVMATPRGEGYYTLHHAYQTLFMEHSDPNTYYASVLTDEIRFETQGWDEILAEYIGHFPDDVFRLRISENRQRNYHSIRECLSSPENYSVTTRKWYELCEGMGDVFWGVDSWHQCIEYYLGQVQTPENWQGIFRGVPVGEIVIRGQEAGEGWVDEAQEERRVMVEKGWQACQTYDAHQKMLRHANRLAFHIYLHEKGAGDYDVREDSALMSYLAYAEPLPNPGLPIYGCQFYLPYGAYLLEQMPRLLDLYRTNPGELAPGMRAWPPVKDIEYLESYFRGEITPPAKLEEQLEPETDRITVMLTASNLGNVLRRFAEFSRVEMLENNITSLDLKHDVKQKLSKFELAEQNLIAFEESIYDALDAFSLSDNEKVSFYRHMSAVREYLRTPDDPNKRYMVQATINWLQQKLAQHENPA